MSLLNADTIALKYVAGLFYTRTLPHRIKIVTYHSPSCAIITLTLNGFFGSLLLSLLPAPSYFNVIRTRLLSRVKFGEGEEEELVQIPQLKV